MKNIDIPKANFRQFIVDLAAQHDLDYRKTYADEWAETVTRLCGDEVVTDDVDQILVTLKRSGVITSEELVSLLGGYLEEINKGLS